MNIVQAGPDDLETVADLFDLYRQFYAQPHDVGKCRQFVSDRISRAESVIFVAYSADPVRSLGFTQLYPTFCSVVADRIFVLYDLFVRSEMRSGGVGTALLNRARDYARDQGAERIELSTHHTNHTAQRLYESLGYVKDNEFFNYALSL